MEGRTFEVVRNKVQGKIPVVERQNKFSYEEVKRLNSITLALDRTASDSGRIC